jgi:hypothetical protein
MPLVKALMVVINIEEQIQPGTFTLRNGARNWLSEGRMA